MIALVVSSQKTCGSNNLKEDCYKGRLEIKGICSNYTIKILQGNIDTAKVAASWTDENTGKVYSNVFALDSPCSFPADIEQGDEFYFRIDTTQEKNCMVCMAYYPTPPKVLRISVADKP